MSNLQQIEADRAANTAQLYYDGQPQWPAQEMEKRLAAIDTTYKEALASELDAARAMRQEAEQIALQASSDPTTWLLSEELTAATARAPFVKEDVAGLDGDKLVNRIKQALASGDKPLQWLLLRYAPETLASPSLHHELSQLRAQLETAVIPEATRQAASKANAQRLAAEQRRVAVAAAMHAAKNKPGLAFNPFSAEYR